MNLDQISFFRLASDRLEWLSSRQKGIAENIANGDTPGYRARDVAPFESYVQAVSAATTDGGGAAAAQPFASSVPVATVDAPDR